MALENQLSRYGAITKDIPFLKPGAKMFIVADSDDTTVGAVNLEAEFPPDKDGVARVYTTIQTAVNAAAAGRGDVILVMPGYDHTLGRADSWTTAGVHVIGLGDGLSRPTLRYTATTDEVGIGANNVHVKNLRFLAAVDSCARAVDLDSGFSGAHIEGCLWDYNATGNDFRVMLRHKQGRSLIENNKFNSESDTAASGKAISFTGDAKYSEIKDNLFIGRFDTTGDTQNGAGIIAADTTDTGDTSCLGLYISGNRMLSTDTAVPMFIRVDTDNTNTGLVCDNYFATLDSGTADTSKFVTGYATTGTGLKFVHNYIMGDSTEKLIADSFVAAA